MSITEYLDQLDQARAKATPGEWYQARHIHVFSESESRPGIGQMYMPADAALIVAAVNAQPKLTAALRGLLDLADELDHDTFQDEDEGWAAGQRYSAGRLRAAITQALGGEL